MSTRDRRRRRRARALEACAVQAAHGARWPAPLLAPRLEELAAAIWPRARLRAAFLPDPTTGAGPNAGASERALAAARGAHGRLRHRPDGRPEIAGANAVSVSHAAGHTLAVCAEHDLACDVEESTERSAETWRDMLGADRHAAAIQPEPQRRALRRDAT
jgi:enediyne polyketide synthase